MGKIGKTLALLLTLIIAISCMTLLTVKPANAQASPSSTPFHELPNPSVPEFTLSFVNSSYSEGGNFFQHEEIVVSINNQLFTPYYVDSHSVNLYHKIHWNTSIGSSVDLKDNTVWVLATNCRRDENGAVLNPNATITTMKFDFSSNNYTVPLGLNPPLPNIPVGGQVDFQVQTLIGYNSGATLYGNSSDWSSIHTITVVASSPSPSPTVPELSWVAIVPLLLSVLSVAAVAVIVRHRKTTKLSKGIS